MRGTTSSVEETDRSTVYYFSFGIDTNQVRSFEEGPGYAEGVDPERGRFDGILWYVNCDVENSFSLRSLASCYLYSYNGRYR